MIKNFKVGDVYEEEWVPTFESLKKYAELSGDYNPIHIDIKAAKKLGRENLIVHGNLTCSVISKIIGMNFPGNGSLILEQNIAFSNPIFPNDLINIKFLIESINYNLKVIEIKIKAHKYMKKNNENKITVLRGKIICQI